MAVLLVSLPVGIHSGSPVAWVTPAAAQTVSIDIFFEPLAPHGRWLRTSRYGYVWVPTRVAAEWRPYTYGHWEYARQFGWVWISDEDWGWATYHYGRWGYDDDYGWFWVPGNRWAPAWVSWQISDDYYGWAPLPPSGSGYAFSASIGSAVIGIGAWRFVSARDFLTTNLGSRILAPSRNSEIIRRTRPAGTVRVVNNVVVNNVVNVTNVEKTTQQKVVVRDIRQVSRPQDAKPAGDAIQVYRPQISSQRPRTTPKDAVQVKTLTDRAAKVKADAPAQGRGLAAQPAPRQPADGAPPASVPTTGDTGRPKGPSAKGTLPRTPADGSAPEPATGKVIPKSPTEKSSPKAGAPAAPKSREATPPPSSKGTERASPPARAKETPESKAPAASKSAPTRDVAPPRPSSKGTAPAEKAPKSNPSADDGRAAPRGKGDEPRQK